MEMLEITQEQWNNAIKSGHYQPIKNHISISEKTLLVENLTFTGAVVLNLSEFSSKYEIIFLKCDIKEFVIQGGTKFTDDVVDITFEACTLEKFSDHLLNSIISLSFYSCTTITNIILKGAYKYITITSEEKSDIVLFSLSGITNTRDIEVSVKFANVKIQSTFITKVKKWHFKQREPNFVMLMS